ncbi:ExbD/TolR family protein [Roseobacter sinensis]|uniref:Biopolymer transporter ExbD n=1 Tax=Roseobacter sinensis TaxID=2931391 RepID=A0ABT3BKA3_9RHOB|nr:biopolymer transporter ExbD [Roseobacter sp. WL0113]MCV3274012.1 biopolymer transporter ExbD [Roseobacter sp. WL0113]
MRARRQTREPTIALINIVFLMLVFFMVAGTLAAPTETPVSLVRTAELEGLAPPDVLVIHADGEMQYGRDTVSDLEAFYEGLPNAARSQIRLMPDRAAPAHELIGVAGQLRSLGADRVLIVTEQALP